ncbi:MAG: NAD+ synthase [Candidatus Lokiarchaeota archaeon]|nr:NAD+ synthase [Candidatus Lokiarchaeota archaeon]
MKKKKNLLICIAQINPIAGDIEYNFNKIKSIIQLNQNADFIIFPEMVLMGYPIMDHIYDPLIRRKNLEAIEKIKNIDSKSTIIFGTFTEPNEIKEKIHCFYNSAIIINNKKIIYVENKRLLPDYDVFDEHRYFSFDKKFDPIEIDGIKVGILICEDVWDENYDIKVAEPLVMNSAEILIVINASPYHIGKTQERFKIVKKKSEFLSIPIIYVNMVGGLDEIVFDGQSFITNSLGQIIFKAKSFEEDVQVVKVPLKTQNLIQETILPIDWRENVIKALELNLYDYYIKSGIFNGIVLGLSGGIDSAFTATICSKAIGTNKIHAIMMPTRFTSKESLELSRNLCKNLDIDYIIHPIDKIFEIYEADIHENLGPVKFDIADENLQARIRATILMYYSNKFNWLLVSTGNKSEIAVGYCTLYGDTCGGKNIPGDLLKIQIYELCNYINLDKEIIPKRIIERPPTAELRENQKDSDSLPDYNTLDLILDELINHGIGDEYYRLEKKGIDKKDINKVRNLYLNSEYKRRQLVQSIKVSKSAFGIGRKYPVLKKIIF